MSILGAMSTAISGLNAQSRAMGHISDNIANSQTVGFKRIDTRFEALITQSNAFVHQPGGVSADPYYANGVQGSIQQGDVPTHMAVAGQGLFAVTRGVQAPSPIAAAPPAQDFPLYFTRAGDFERNADGYLVNNASYFLMG
ncbi:MAG: flagellar hook basal-body protein, partial [Alphaproteobacteria bacterium]|nr:flagellar hook basal-body protein [Alphaproteobacteria bacterium]